jgi:hypothetical protein
MADSIIKIGDTFTIEGVYRMVPNPDRRWWQLWKPRLAKKANELQMFRVVGWH